MFVGHFWRHGQPIKMLIFVIKLVWVLDFWIILINNINIKQQQLSLFVLSNLNVDWRLTQSWKTNHDLESCRRWDRKCWVLNHLIAWLIINYAKLMPKLMFWGLFYWISFVNGCLSCNTIIIFVCSKLLLNSNPRYNSLWMPSVTGVKLDLARWLKINKMYQVKLLCKWLQIQNSVAILDKALNFSLKVINITSYWKSILMFSLKPQWSLPPPTLNLIY